MGKQTEPKFFSTQVAQAKRFYLEKSRTKESRLKVVCGGCEHTSSDFEIDRENSPYYCIEFVAKGAIKFMVPFNFRSSDQRFGMTKQFDNRPPSHPFNSPKMQIFGLFSYTHIGVLEISSPLLILVIFLVV